tara:strand:- start:740 stop:1681 length:942 start_codon:yes stop_codon:yes gene_type:complete
MHTTLPKKRPRHPEKAWRPDNLIKRKPKWIRVRSPNSKEFNQTLTQVRNLNLTTVCEEASCPNIGECWKYGHATFMILGDICTRGCSFCNVATGKPNKIDPLEPENIGIATKNLALSHVVVTSVDRDDLSDGGADQFIRVIKKIREHSPSTTIEILTPDFYRKPKALPIIIAEQPDVFNHNMETIKRLYKKIRPGANYGHSLNMLKEAKKINQKIFTKSGIMVGLGETKEEVKNIINDIRESEVDFITIGQYLQPTSKHISVDRFVHPDEFDEYQDFAKALGFLMVSASPLTRSSFHAGKDFVNLKKARENIK